MPIRIQQNVLGLEVAVYDVLVMQMVERQRHLCGVKLGNGIGEALQDLKSGQDNIDRGWQYI